MLRVKSELEWLFFLFNLLLFWRCRYRRRCGILKSPTMERVTFIFLQIFL